MKYIINPDWLSFSVLLAPSQEEREQHTWFLSCPPGWRIQHLSGTNIYRNRTICYNAKGEKMLTLLYSPHSHVIDYRSCLVEVANKWLYCGFDWALDRLYQIHPFAYNNISRFDICCDFQLSPERERIIKGLASNSYYVANKREGSMFHDFSQTERGKIMRLPKCISWGSKSSSLKWKCYNKSKEICTFDADGKLVTCEKPYILAEWENAGYDIHKVWRLELSITQAHKFEWLGEAINIHKIRNYFYFEEMFVSLYSTRFVIRKNEGHKDKTNDKRVHLLEFPELRTRLDRKEPQSEKEAVEFIGVVNALMRQRALPECQINDTIYNGLTRTIIEVVHSANLEAYFNKVYGYSIEDIDRLKCDNIWQPATKKVAIMPTNHRFRKRAYRQRTKRFQAGAELYFNANQKRFYLHTSENLENPDDKWWDM